MKSVPENVTNDGSDVVPSCTTHVGVTAAPSGSEVANE